MLAKFQDYWKSITMSSFKYKNIKKFVFKIMNKRCISRSNNK